MEKQKKKKMIWCLLLQWALTLQFRIQSAVLQLSISHPMDKEHLNFTFQQLSHCNSLSNDIFAENCKSNNGFEANHYKVTISHLENMCDNIGEMLLTKSLQVNELASFKLFQVIDFQCLNESGFLDGFSFSSGPFKWYFLQIQILRKSNAEGN